MTKRELDAVCMRNALESVPYQWIEMTMRLLATISRIQGNTLRSRISRIAVSELLHAEFNKEDLRRSLEVLERIHQCILVNQRAREEIAARGLLSVISGSGKFILDASFLNIPNNYPIKAIEEKLSAIYLIKKDKLNSGRLITLVLHEKHGLYRKHEEHLRYRVTRKRMRLLTLLADGEQVSTNELLREFTDEANFNVKASIREINKHCIDKLVLPTNLIIGEKGFGYRIDTEKYIIEKKKSPQSHI